jgi:hypothetical protein
MKESFGEFNNTQKQPEAENLAADFENEDNLAEIPDEVLRSLAEHRNDIPESVIESIEKQDLKLAGMFADLATGIREKLEQETDPTKRASLEKELRNYEELAKMAQHQN